MSSWLTHIKDSSNAPADVIRILLIEDNPADAELLIDALDTDADPTIDIIWTDRLELGLNMLTTEHFDILLLDLTLPDSVALHTLKAARHAAPEVPIIIFTGLYDKELGLEAVKEGAQDFLVKGQPSAESIHRAIRYAIERNRADLEARETAEKLRLALEASKTGVFTWWVKQNRHEWSTEVLKIFGGVSVSSHEEFMDRIHPDDRSLVHASLEAALTGKVDYAVEYRINWPDGSEHWVKAMGKTYYDHLGQPIKMTGVCQDITQRKEREETKRRLAVMEQRQEFVAMLAHDLRSPIIGSDRILNLVLDGTLGEVPATVKDVLAKICASNQIMLDMITNVMDCYRLEAGAETFQCAPLDVESLVVDTVSQMKPLADSAGLSLSFCSQGIEKVVADKIALQRVLSNLIGNAIKFTPSGGSIEVSAFARDGEAVLLIKDTGIGIAAEDLAHIFDRFYQCNAKYRAKGLGLGLYLCRKLVECQNGRICCTSSIGKGTTFEIVLPLQPATRRFQIVDDSEVTAQVLKQNCKN